MKLLNGMNTLRGILCMLVKKNAFGKLLEEYDRTGQLGTARDTGQDRKNKMNILSVDVHSKVFVLYMDISYSV